MINQSIVNRKLFICLLVVLQLTIVTSLKCYMALGVTSVNGHKADKPLTEMCASVLPKEHEHRVCFSEIRIAMPMDKYETKCKVSTDDYCKVLQTSSDLSPDCGFVSWGSQKLVVCCCDTDNCNGPTKKLLAVKDDIRHFCSMNKMDNSTQMQKMKYCDDKHNGCYFRGSVYDPQSECVNLGQRLCQGALNGGCRVLPNGTLECCCQVSEKAESKDECGPDKMQRRCPVVSALQEHKVEETCSDNEICALSVNGSATGNMSIEGGCQNVNNLQPSHCLAEDEFSCYVGAVPGSMQCCCQGDMCSKNQNVHNFTNKCKDGDIVRLCQDKDIYCYTDSRNTLEGKEKLSCTRPEDSETECRVTKSLCVHILSLAASGYLSSIGRQCCCPATSGDTTPAVDCSTQVPTLQCHSSNKPEPIMCKSDEICYRQTPHDKSEKESLGCRQIKMIPMTKEEFNPYLSEEPMSTRTYLVQHQIEGSTFYCQTDLCNPPSIQPKPDTPEKRLPSSSSTSTSTSPSSTSTLAQNTTEKIDHGARAESPDTDNHSYLTGVIVGVALGIICLFLLVVVGIYFWNRKAKRQTTETASELSEIKPTTKNSGITESAPVTTVNDFRTASSQYSEKDLTTDWSTVTRPNYERLENQTTMTMTTDQPQSNTEQLQ